MPRSLGKVIEKMLVHIPPDNEAHAKLKATKQSVLYMAPELHGDLWDRCATILNENLGHPDAEWKVKVAQIFSGDKES